MSIQTFESMIGQTMSSVYEDPTFQGFDFAWVPECDLEILEVVKSFSGEEESLK